MTPRERAAIEARALAPRASAQVMLDSAGFVWLLPFDPAARAIAVHRDALEFSARWNPRLRWCGLTASEILVRLDKWLSARNG